MLKNKNRHLGFMGNFRKRQQESNPSGGVVLPAAAF